MYIRKRNMFSLNPLGSNKEPVAKCNQQGTAFGLLKGVKFLHRQSDY